MPYAAFSGRNTLSTVCKYRQTFHSAKSFSFFIIQEIPCKYNSGGRFSVCKISRRVDMKTTVFLAYFFFATSLITPLIAANSTPATGQMIQLLPQLFPL